MTTTQSFRVLLSGDNPLLLRMSGAVNENADLAPVKFSPKTPVEMDLGELTSINSVGIRSFSGWANL